VSGATRLALGACTAVALLSAPLSAAAPAVEGLWLTDDGKGVVEIAACGQRLCGRIARVLETGPDVPSTDVNNPDSRQRGRPLVGLQVLSGFSGGPTRWEGGQAYDPKNGSSYKSSLRLNADGSLRVTGCVLIVCRSKRWTRFR
jgi:uncharacterized protein (DUF2147 family)